MWSRGLRVFSFPPPDRCAALPLPEGDRERLPLCRERHVIQVGGGSRAGSCWRAGFARPLPGGGSEHSEQGEGNTQSACPGRGGAFGVIPRKINITLYKLLSLKQRTTLLNATYTEASLNKLSLTTAFKRENAVAVIAKPISAPEPAANHVDRAAL